SENLFSLNDLHRAGGGESKHQPAFFVRLDTTQDLISEIQKEDPNFQPLKSINGGANRGTYACMEIALAYASWIDPKFHLVVLRAYMAMKAGEHSQNNQQIAPLAPPPKKYSFDFTEDELQSLVWAWFAFVRGIHTFRYIYPMFQKLGSNMAGEIYGQGFEYSHTAQSAHKILERITREFDFDPMTNWRVLKHVRGFDPAFKKPTF
ncbi:P22AR C-terminal domain-containing protein, partial [Mannheimia haemolytica]|uniref:P22AR C-terminal domain-containing protein n=1 Tax=Mannheimia haemolytica TaxID=75985 RepID=UPI0018646A3E